MPRKRSSGRWPSSGAGGRRVKYLDAAYEVLKASGQPLHSQEITARALRQGLIAPQGLTPEATMASRLYTDTKKAGSRFARAGRGLFRLAEQVEVGIDVEVDRLNLRTRKRLWEALGAMPPAGFEALIGQLLVEMGFDEDTVQVTQLSGDGGIDVRGTYRAAGLTEVNAAVQVKRWKHNVQAPTVTQLRGSLEVHQQGIIITTGGFTAGARAEATAPGKVRIGLIDGQELLELLIRHRVGVEERQLPILVLDEGLWGEPAAAPGTEAEVAVASTGAGSTNAGDPTGHRPTHYSLGKHAEKESTWQEVLVGVCARLAKEEGAAFTALAGQVGGRKRALLATSSAAMIRPKSVPGTALSVETNLSAKGVLRLIRRLLTALGRDEGEFQVAYD
jgi:restriction system protein